MGRPRKDPSLRFADVRHIYEAAMENDGLRLEMPTISRAVHIVHRLNLYRKAQRELSDDPIIKADGFVFRSRENIVEIERRHVVDISHATTMDGQPLREPARPPSPFDPATQAALDAITEAAASSDGLMTEDEWYSTNKQLREMGMIELPRDRVRPKGGKFVE